MSSDESGAGVLTNGAGRLSVAAALAAAVLLAGCTVRPLYDGGSSVTGAIAPSQDIRLGQIDIGLPDTRQEQEVRNHLLFLFGGGTPQAAEKRYRLELDVTASVTSAAQVQVATEEEPTAGLVIMRGTYSLSDIATGEIIASGRRQTTSAYDVPRQEFAALRAVRDAENRAARELAEFIRLAVAQELERPPG